ncbi:MAG: LacI family transcriptional regulator [Actinomycetota bacterium]|nr:LacI family transcriptional regulator [Actinomycetota bacterium]
MTASDRAASAPPTLRDVASHAGVSPMTVSRALRDDRGVSVDTRRRVREAASQLGYRRNELARRLRMGGRTGLVGLIVPNLANPFYSRLALGLESALESSGLKLVLGNTGEDQTREQRMVNEVIERRVDGIVVVPASTDHEHLRPAALNGTPIVFAARPPQGLDADCVLVDDFGGARNATRALIDDGHTAIGLIGNVPTLYTGAERFRGFCAAIREADLPVANRHIERDCTDVRSAQIAVTRMLTRNNRPTALFTANNRMTLGALLAAGDLQQPVALAGFDALEYAPLIDRRLILVDYDSDEIGRRAGELLVDRLTASPERPARPPARVTVATTLRR